MLTADEYRIAIKVLREHDCKDLAEGFLGFVEKANKKEEYVSALGFLGRADAPETRGLLILAKIFGDGWTPPKGMF